MSDSAGQSADVSASVVLAIKFPRQPLPINGSRSHFLLANVVRKSNGFSLYLRQLVKFPGAGSGWVEILTSGSAFVLFSYSLPH